MTYDSFHRVSQMRDQDALFLIQVKVTVALIKMRITLIQTRKLFLYDVCKK